jgi:hypothetical protein
MRSYLAALFVCTAAGLSAAVQQAPAPTTQQPPAPAPTAPTQPAPKPPAAPADPQAPAAGTPAPPPQTTRVLAEDAGLIFFPVKPDRSADFEKIMAKLKEALATSQNPAVREQAAGWKVFKAVEPGPNASALYVFVIDPAVKGADYAFWKTLYDSFPAEVLQLYRLYSAATAGGQSLLNLQLVQSFGTKPPQ